MTTRVPPAPPPVERELRWPVICTECCGPALMCFALLFVLLYSLMLIGTIPNPILNNDIYFNNDDTSCTSMSNYYAMHWWLILKGLSYLAVLVGVIGISAVLIFIIVEISKHCIGLCNGTRVCCTEETKLNCKKGCIDCFNPYETVV